MRTRRAAQRSRELTSFASELASPRGTASRVLILCKGMLQQFGGLDHLCTAWKQHIEAAGARRPGGRVVMQGLRAIMRLIEISDIEARKESRIRPSKIRRRDVETMSTKELEQEMVHSIESLVQDHPELVVAAARRIGWTVIPPDRDPCVDHAYETAEHRQAHLAAEA